jgi:penicillin-binding protein 2
MTELRNVEADLSRFRGRVLVASVAVLVLFLLLVSRLVVLQVVRHEELDEQAEANRTAIVPIVPNRGPDPGSQRHRAGDQLLRLHAGDHAPRA